MHVVFDLDGTIANIDHRRHLVEVTQPPKLVGEPHRPVIRPDWKAFFRACVDDTPNLQVIYLMNLLHHNGNIIDIWSGRSDVVEPETIAWLERYKVPFNRLVMRPQGDFTPDESLKRSWILKHGRPDLVFDDRGKVVAMWRSLGIPCFQVAEGKF